MNHQIWLFKGQSWSATAPTAKPDLQDSSTLFQAHLGMPKMSQANRDTGWIGGLTKVVIYPMCANSLQKVVVHATLIQGLRDKLPS